MQMRLGDVGRFWWVVHQHCFGWKHAAGAGARAAVIAAGFASDGYSSLAVVFVVLVFAGSAMVVSVVVVVLVVAARPGGTAAGGGSRGR